VTTLRNEIYIFAILGVETVGVLILLEDLAGDHGAVFAGIGRDLAHWSGERLADNLDTGLLVVVMRPHLLEHLAGTQESNAAAGKNAFLDCRMVCAMRSCVARPNTDHRPRKSRQFPDTAR